MIVLFQLLSLILRLLTLAVFVQVILSWLLAFNVVSRYNQLVGGLYRGLEAMLEPLYRPIRRILPNFGQLDLAPMVLLLIVFFLQSSVMPYVFTLGTDYPA